MIELKKKEFKFKYEEEVITLKSPSVSDLEFLQNEIKEKGESVSIVLDFLEKVGLQKKIASEMPVDHINLIVETLVNEKKK